MKINGNPIMQGATGKLAEAVFKQFRGQLIVSKSPKKRSSSSAAQEKVKDKFRDAVYYAKGAVENVAFNAMYSEAVSDSKPSVYHVAFTDYLKAPEIKNIDATFYTGAVGEFIDVRAVDDFQVASVFVELRDANDVVLESGAAVQNGNKMLWQYKATQANAALAGTKIIVTAKDLPGNTTTKNVVL